MVGGMSVDRPVTFCWQGDALHICGGARHHDALRRSRSALCGRAHVRRGSVDGLCREYFSGRE